MAFLFMARSAEPWIYQILLTNNVGRAQVEIHFTSEAFRTYVVQANTNGLGSTNWTDMITYFAVPQPLHRIFTDSRTNNKARFYRLRVTP